MHRNTKKSYKLLKFTVQANQKETAVRFVDLFNKKFKKGDTYSQIMNNTLYVYLRQLDLVQLNQLIQILDVPFVKKVYQRVNKIGSYGIKSGKRVFIDYNKERKVVNRKKKEESRVKYFYAHKNNFAKINVKIPASILNKIICGDSEFKLKKLPDNCIDLVFTSPPYNFGLEYQNHQDENFWQEYFDKLFRILKETIRVLKYGGRIVINIQPLFSDYIPSHHMISHFMMENKMIWKGEILWEKNNYNCKYTAWGSWKSPSNPYLKYTWEFLEVFSKGILKKGGNKDKIDIDADEFKKWVIAKWSIAPESGMKKFNHPAMFPQELAKRVLKLFSFKDDIILDPFNGVGTTTLVARQLGRKFIGIDTSEEYCETARRRLSDNS